MIKKMKMTKFISTLEILEIIVYKKNTIFSTEKNLYEFDDQIKFEALSVVGLEDVLVGKLVKFNTNYLGSNLVNNLVSSSGNSLVNNLWSSLDNSLGNNLASSSVTRLGNNLGSSSGNLNRRTLWTLPSYLGNRKNNLVEFVKIPKRFTHSGKGSMDGISRLLGGLNNAVARQPYHSSPYHASPYHSSPYRSSIGTARPLVQTSGEQAFSGVSGVSDVFQRSLSTLAKGSISRFPNQCREYDHYLRDETCYQVLKTVVETPYKSKDDRILAQSLLEIFLKNKNYNNRYFQISLERLFEKKLFELDAVLEVVPDEFTLIDLFNHNGYKVHQSTLFTAFQCHQLANQPGFSEKIETKIIIQTPMGEVFGKSMDYKLHKKILNMQRATGNSCPDVQLNDQPYDFKLPMDNSVPIARNAIVSIQAYNTAALNKFIREWKSYIGTVQKQNTGFSNDSISYYTSLFWKVKAIDDNTSLSTVEKILAINKINFNDLDSRPIDSLIPIVIPVGSPTYVPDIGEKERLNLPVTKDTDPKQLDQKFNFIIQTLERHSLEILHIRTGGLFGTPLSPVSSPSSPSSPLSSSLSLTELD
jgi:hypothetical protein